MFTVSHSEFVDTIFYGTTASESGAYRNVGLTTSVPGYDLNPENEILFPWLSQQAANWELYSFSKVRFVLVPKQPTTASGWSLMAFDYDYGDEVATTKRAALLNQSVVEGSVFEETTLDLDIQALNRTHKTRYVQSRGVEGLDSRQVFGGFLVVGLDGLAPSFNYSFDLWIEYTVCLSIPRVGTSTIMSSVEGVETYCFCSNGGTVFGMPVPLGSIPLGNLGTVIHPSDPTYPALDGLPGITTSYDNTSIIRLSNANALRNGNKVLRFTSNSAATFSDEILVQIACFSPTGSFLGAVSALGAMANIGGNSRYGYIEIQGNENLWPANCGYILPMCFFKGVGVNNSTKFTSGYVNLSEFRTVSNPVLKAPRL
jgi:hypothetical protein